MREFDNFERSIIAIISDNEVQSVATLFQNIFPGFDFRFALEPPDFRNYLTLCTYEDYDINDSQPIYNKIVAAIVLLEYLEDNYLIRLHNAFPVVNMEIATGDYKVNLPVNDAKITELLLEKWNYTIFCSSALRTFVKRNYRWQEEVNFKRQYTVTWVGIIVAILIGIASIWISIERKGDVRQDKTTTIQRRIIFKLI